MRASAPAGSRRWRLDPGLAAGAVIATLGLVIVVALAPFIPGLLGAPVLAVLFAPLYQRLSRVVRPAVAAALVLVTAIAVVLLPGLAIAGLLVREAPNALSAADLTAVFTRLSSIRIHDVPIGTDVVTMTREIVAWISRQLVTLAGSAARAAVNLVIAFFGLYYLLRSGDAAWDELSNYSPFSRKTTERLRTKFRNVTRATLLGIGLGSLVQAVVVGTGFAVTGLPNPVLWGTVTGMVSVLPMLGASMVWMSGTVILFAAHRIAAAVLLLLIGSLISAHVETFIRPIVSRRVSRIHPLITLVGAFAGVRYIGLPGLLLGPLALAYFFELLQAFEVEFLGREAPVAEIGR